LFGGEDGFTGSGMVNRSAKQCDFAMREIERSANGGAQYMRLINPFCCPTCSPTLMLQLRLYMGGDITVLIEIFGYLTLFRILVPT